MPEPVCPFCGDGPQSIGTNNHIECVESLMAERDTALAIAALYEGWQKKPEDVLSGVEEIAAPYARRLAELRAENERLRVCGTCRHAAAVRVCAGVWTMTCGAGAHGDKRHITVHSHCHFTPSRWAPYWEEAQ